MGRNNYTLNQFRANYAQFQSHFPNIDEESMLRLLYNWGIIMNVRVKTDEWYSVIRNERSVFNRDLYIRTHPGFYEGLHTSKFLQR